LHSKIIKQSKQKANFFLAWARLILPEQKIYHLSENSPESTPAPGPFSLERNYSRLGENTSSPG